MSGVVHLVGAGPGDPGLLTLRAAELLRAADVVFHDALVSPEVLALIPATVEVVDVGKRAGRPSTPQDEIQRLLIAHAREGRRVVRLKGGDPMLFGRGAEELSALIDAGVACELVPGVSSAIAVPGLAGIPVTHRALSGAVTVLTARGASTGRPELSWASFAATDHTLVVLMARERAGEVADRLLEGGRPPDTPTAIIFSGTTPRQTVARARLDRLGDTAAALQADGPALVVVGPVATLCTATP